MRATIFQASHGYMLSDNRCMSKAQYGDGDILFSNRHKELPSTTVRCACSYKKLFRDWNFRLLFCIAENHFCFSTDNPFSSSKIHQLNTRAFVLRGEKFDCCCRESDSVHISQQ